MRIELPHDIQIWNDTQCVEYYVNCFDRTMYVYYKNINYRPKEIEKMIDDLYYEWHENEDDSCCEEYILDSLPQDIRDSIAMVIYVYNDDDLSDY